MSLNHSEDIEVQVQALNDSVVLHTKADLQVYRQSSITDNEGMYVHCRPPQQCTH